VIMLDAFFQQGPPRPAHGDPVRPLRGPGHAAAGGLRGLPARREWQTVPLEGSGTVASFTVFRVPPRGGAAVPYAVAQVRLREASPSSAASSTSPRRPRHRQAVRFRPLVEPHQTGIAFGPPPERASPRRAPGVIESSAPSVGFPTRFLTGGAADTYHSESSAAALRQGGAVRFADPRLDRIRAKVCARSASRGDEGLTLFETGRLLGLRVARRHVKTRCMATASTSSSTATSTPPTSACCRAASATSRASQVGPAPSSTRSRTCSG